MALTKLAFIAVLDGEDIKQEPMQWRIWDNTLYCLEKHYKAMPIPVPEHYKYVKQFRFELIPKSLDQLVSDGEDSWSDVVGSIVSSKVKTSTRRSYYRKICGKIVQSQDPLFRKVGYYLLSLGEKENDESEEDATFLEELILDTERILGVGLRRMQDSVYSKEQFLHTLKFFTKHMIYENAKGG